MFTNLLVQAFLGSSVNRATGQSPRVGASPFKMHWVWLDGIIAAWVGEGEAQMDSKETRAFAQQLMKEVSNVLEEENREQG